MKICTGTFIQGIFRLPVSVNTSLLLNHYGQQLEKRSFLERINWRWENRSMQLWMDLSKLSSDILDTIGKDLSADKRYHQYKLV
ncbi:MAG: hypothetical protein ABR503_16030 [Chitinophagaceae bacterium]